MCGIFSYSGKQPAIPIILNGLKRLEYRGYDSWGVAVLDGSLSVAKQVGSIGPIGDLPDLPEGAHIGIGHTRWATHGGVTKNNAHPHFATDKSFVVAQNGIVENFLEIKQQLQKKGYVFTTQTDTEVIVRLIEDEQKKIPEFRHAVRSAFLKLTGRNTIIVLTTDNQIIAVRNGSPLVIGCNTDDNSIYISSDTLSMAAYTQKVCVIDNGQMVTVDGLTNAVCLFDLQTDTPHPLTFVEMQIKSIAVEKGQYKHFMIKEIFESPFVIEQLLLQDKNQYPAFLDALKKADQIYTIGSGTAGNAAASMAYYLRMYAGLNAISLIGADSYEYYHLFKKGDVIIAPSQSGETADVLEVLEIAKKKGMSIASFVNMPGSMMSKMSDFAFMAQAGPEICVMSTKIFVSQVAWGYLIAKMLAGKREEAEKQLRLTADTIKTYLEDKQNHTEVKKLAKQLLNTSDIFLLGKAQNLPIIKEAMVKLIEGTYKHAHAIPAGDLKHYAITLMGKDVPVIAVFSNDGVKTDIENAVNEVKARGATVIGVGPENLASFDHFIAVSDLSQTSALLNVIPLQLLSYYMADMLGNSVDKPRNIAKSVTVK